MSDRERGERMIEEMVPDPLLDSFPARTRRTVTDEGGDRAEPVNGSPDFIRRALSGMGREEFDGLEFREVCAVDFPDAY